MEENTDYHTFLNIVVKEMLHKQGRRDASVRFIFYKNTGESLRRYTNSVAELNFDKLVPMCIKTICCLSALHFDFHFLGNNCQ